MSARGVIKTYGGHTVLRGVELTVEAGSVHGLLGPNGAGKSTLMGIMGGLRSTDAGLVHVGGREPGTDRPWIRRHLHFQPQRTDLFSHLTVAETVRLWRRIRRATSSGANRLMRDLGLNEIADQQVRSLSGGQHRRLLVVTTLMGDPKFVILDEPTAGVDPNACDAVWAAVRDVANAGAAVLVSTHGVEEVERHADDVTVLVDGEVVAQGRPADLLDQHFSTSVLSLQCSPAYLLRVRESLPELHFVPAGDDTHHLHTEQPTRVIEDLAQRTGLPPKVTISRPGMGDLFRSLTGENPRQVADATEGA